MTYQYKPRFGPLRPNKQEKPGRKRTQMKFRTVSPNLERRGNLRATIHEQCCHSDSRVPVSEAAKKLERKAHNYNKWEAKQNRG